MDAFLPLAALTAKGLARQAALAPVLLEKRRVEYKRLPAKRWITRVKAGSEMYFDWTINPYRGCEFGCQYCYARYTHEFLEREGSEAFESEIFVKEWDPGAFRSELRRIPKGERIAIGTATDPYQPAERRFRRTRQLLEVLAEGSGRSIGLITKSDAVAADASVLARIAARNELSVGVTITTLDAALARKLEPFAPRPDLRIEAVQALASAGVPVSVTASPVIPGITATRRNLEELAAAAHQAGARGFQAGLLFLRDSARKVFFPFVAREFPDLTSRYQQRYGRAAYLPEESAAWLARLVAELRVRYGFEERRRVPMKEEGQLNLFMQKSA